MRPYAGKRDTLITFETRSETQNATTGSYTYTWATHAQEWAEVQDMLPSRAENVAEGINLQRRPCRIRTMFRDDINSTMRITFEGRTVQIVAGPVELGRRDGLEMVCEEYSTEGNAP